MRWTAFPAILCTAFLACAGCSSGESSTEASDSVQDLQDLSEAGAPECEDGTVFWPEHGVCAPPMEECANAWEMPVVGGGCTVVGPRACPRTWDPLSDAQCEAGELLPCEEGFALQEDGAACVPVFDDDCVGGELPLFGGGCLAVGPKWAAKGADGTLFDDCDPGYLALPGGGCVPAGPRGCLGLWDGDPAGCLSDDLHPCPDGWTPGEDELTCEPDYGECGPGERGLPGGGCAEVLPGPEECPQGPFPEQPEGCEEPLYVLAGSGCTDACGAEQAPYPDLQSALEEAGDGGCVLVGSGEYAEGLYIDHPVTVAGLCAAAVKLTSPAPVPGEVEGKVQSATVMVNETAGVRLSGLTLSADTVGIAVVASTDVKLSGIAIEGVSGVALFGTHKSAVEAESLLIRDVGPADGPGLDGLGSWFEEGADLVVTKGLIEEVTGRGVYTNDEGATFEAMDLTIRKVSLTDSGFGGEGLYCKNYSKGSLHRALIEDTHSAAVKVTNDADAYITQSLIRRVHQNGKNDLGKGLWISGTGTAYVSETVIEGASKIGVVVDSSGTEVKLERVVVRKPQADGPGWGVDAWGMGSLTMHGCLVDGSRDVGVAAYDEGTELEISGSVVRGTNGKVGAGGSSGAGITAVAASITVLNSVVENNQAAGILAQGDSQVVLQGSVVSGSFPDSKGINGMGLALNGAHGTVSSSLFDRNHTEGIVVGGGGGAYLLLEDSVVRDGETDDEGQFGRGVFIYEGAQALITGSVIERNREIGLVAAGNDTVVEVEETIIRESIPWDDGLFGRGVSVSHGAFAHFRHCLVADNSDSGMIVGTGATEVLFEDGAIVRTACTGFKTPGRGLTCQNDAFMELSRSLLEENHNVSLSGYKGCEMVVDKSSVRRTRDGPEGYGGYGVMWVEGGELRMSDSVVEENLGVGLLAGLGASLALERVVVRETDELPENDGALGHGVGLGGQAAATIDGCLIDGSQHAGVSVGYKGTALLVQGTIIRNTRADHVGHFGNGLFVRLEAEALVEHCLLDNNQTSGITVAELGTTVTVADSVVSNTLPGGGVMRRSGVRHEHLFGDGISVVLAELSLGSTLLEKNSRAGVFMTGSSGYMEGNVIRDNLSYGLALEACGDAVNFAELGNAIFGNAASLPPSERLQVSDSPGDLPAPPAPEMAKAQLVPEEE